MKTIFSAVVACLLFLGSLAQATPIVSQGTGMDPWETNSTGNPTIVIPQHPGWAAALPGSNWVSYGQTGDPNAPGYFVVPNNTVVSFYQQVLVHAIVISAPITLRADDSTALYVNNLLVVSEATQAGNTYAQCSDFEPGCRVITQTTVDIKPYLNIGLNTLRFDVAQRNFYSYGLNYAGSVNEVPEPATAAFMLAGIAVLAALRFRQRRPS